MRILYLHQFFVTRAGVGGTRSYEFARRFVARGHEVRIVTAAGAAGPGTSDVEGIEVVAVRGAYSDYVSATSLSNARRMLAFGRFALSATAAALRGPRPDVVYATSPPLTMALPALAVAAARRVPLVWEVRDLWPEAPIQMGALRNPLLRRAARFVERFVYRRAARLMALSPGIRDGMVAAGARAERVALVPNASDLDLFLPAEPPERFRVSYFGTMGEANDLTAAVEAARLLPDVEFLLVGDGKRRAELERGSPPNVVFTGPVGGKDEVAELAAASSACLTLFKDVPVLATNSPNKLFDTFAAGRPAIVNMDGWMRQLVEENEAGLYVRAGNARELADRIAWLREHPAEAERMGRNARALAEREFGRDELAARALGVLEEAVR
jgi:glycosyltransferase involved in cell wall biosynthesis